jgi:hypothetical protein
LNDCSLSTHIFLLSNSDVDRAGNEGTIPLPDIREARMKKVQEAVEKEMEPERVKIKRGDTKALREVRTVKSQKLATVVSYLSFSLCCNVVVSVNGAATLRRCRRIEF